MPAGRAAPPGESKDVLVVDDERYVRLVLSRMLERLGHRPRPAASGAEALEVLASEPVDAALCDVSMPGMDGFAVLDELRARRPDVKTAMISGYLLYDYVRMVRDHGVHVLVPKPLDIDEVGAGIERLFHPERAFGLAAHLAGPAEMEKAEIRGFADLGKVAARADAFAAERKAGTNAFRIVLEEVLLNAFYHGQRLPDGRDKYAFLSEVELAPEEFVAVAWGADRAFVGFSVEDRGGTLPAGELLERLCASQDGASTLSADGRGLAISFDLADRLIVNMDAGRRTEVVALFSRRPGPERRRALCINEVRA